MAKKDGTPRRAKESKDAMQATVTPLVAPLSANKTVLSNVGSFDEFYRSHYDTLARGLILSLGNRDLGIEATDEAFLRAFKHWANVQGYANPAGWVYRVGMNWARTKLRRGKKEVPSLWVDSTSDQRFRVEPGLDAALDSLPDKHRRVIVLRYYLDWSLEEIAEALRIPKGTVKSRLHRALKALQEHMGVEL